MKKDTIGNVGLVKVCVQILANGISILKLKDPSWMSVGGRHVQKMELTAVYHRSHWQACPSAMLDWVLIHSETGKYSPAKSVLPYQYRY